MGPSATTLMMRRSSVPCGRSNLSSVFFIPVASTYTSLDVEGQGIRRVSAQLPALCKTVRKLGSVWSSSAVLRLATLLQLFANLNEFLHMLLGPLAEYCARVHEACSQR